MCVNRLHCENTERHSDSLDLMRLVDLVGGHGTWARNAAQMGGDHCRQTTRVTIGHQQGVSSLDVAAGNRQGIGDVKHELADMNTCYGSDCAPHTL